jgi:hypothetical protein
MEKTVTLSWRNKRMNRLVLATTLGLAIAGCAHSVPVAQRLQQEEEKCALVQALLREPVPAQRLAGLISEGEELLERYFAGESPECGAAEFRVVRQLGRQGLVLYLQETQDGYSYDAQKAGPEELSMGGSPQGVIRRSGGGGWVAVSEE